MLELLQYYHEEVQHLQAWAPQLGNPYGGAVAPGGLAWAMLLSGYVTSLTYFLNTRHLDGLRHDLDTHTNPRLEAEGLLPLTLHELSGGVPTWEVAKVLTHLESPDDATLPDAVVATNMVSHGVDIDRLNAMFFYGMPRNTAEYIQASSRIGRRHVGIVFVCFNPPRERDQSHYGYFEKNHEFLGQMVEPVAINRWARFGARKTLPGLFMGVLLQCLSRERPGRWPSSYYFLRDVKQMIVRGTLSSRDILPLLEEAYLVPDLASVPNGFREEIQDGVTRALDQILGSAGDRTFVSQALDPGAMMSLREVDEQLPIALDFRGCEWGTRSEQSGGE
jgi:hypothetical protein